MSGVDIQDRVQSILTACQKLQRFTTDQVKALPKHDMMELDFQLSAADNALDEAVEILEEGGTQ